jgi:hypothetical protein
MVDSAKGITNFHSPNDIIVDASMPAMIRRAARCGAPTASSTTARRDAGIDLRPHLPGDDQLLQMERQLRSGDHGHGAQRRPDGPAGRGIRLARQDLRDRRRRRGQHRRPRHRRSAADAERRGRRHLAHVPGQGRADPRLGQAGRHPRPQLRHAGDLLARPLPSARERADQEGRRFTSRITTPAASTSRSCRRCAPCATRWSASSAASTPFR